MNDFISRSALIEFFEKARGHPDNLLRDLVFLDGVLSAIDSAPALDVAPVVHARWIPIKLYGGDHAIKCSACNNCDNPSKVPGRYCWQCGARMDGDAHER